jgi:hypothetical protein
MFAKCQGARAVLRQLIRQHNVGEWPKRVVSELQNSITITMPIFRGQKIFDHRKASELQEHGGWSKRDFRTQAPELPLKG